MFWGGMGSGAVSALVVVGLLASAASAQAQGSGDVVVGSCTDPGLRQAIADAPPGATIRFGCDGEIVLDETSGSIEIQKELTIDGSGSDVSINGDGRMRPFFLSGNTTITMRDLTIRAGRVIEGTIGGGAVFVANTKLVADDVRFVGNYAEPRGGAIAVFGAVGALEVTDSEFLGNSMLCANPECFRGGGGAINVNAGGLTRIESSSFRNNSTAALTQGGSGGAVHGEFTFSESLDGPIEIVDSVFEGNQASNLDLSADQPAGGGGAVAAFNHALTIEGSRFEDNVAASIQGITRGGAVNVGAQFDEPQTQKPASIVDSTFTDNRARGGAGFGGAISTASVPLQIDASLIRGNSAISGGALLAFAPVSITDSRLVANIAGGGADGGGGGVFAGHTITFEGSDILDNSPDGCFRFEAANGEIIDAGDNFETPGTSCAFAPIARPALAIGDASVIERGAGELTRAQFDLALSEPLAYPLRVVYSTVDGTAIAGQDYEPANGELTIAAGETTARVLVDVRGDGEAEPDEAFALQLSLPEPGRTTLANGGRAVATVLDDDGPPPPAPPPDETPPPAETPPPGEVPDTSVPLISEAKARPDKLRVGRKVTVSWRLSEPARVTLLIERLRRERAPKQVGNLERDGEQGLNLTRFRRIGDEELGRGRHRVTLTAVDDAGNVSEPRSATFKLRPRRDG